MSRWLTIDVGTTQLKAAVVDDGIVGPVVAEPYPLRTPRPGWAEQDPSAWWAACRRAVRRLNRQTSNLSGIAVTGQMQDLIVVSGRQPVDPAILYSDQRAIAETEELVARMDGWQAVAGSPIDATNVAAKWKWLVTHQPQRAASADVVVFGGHSAVVTSMTGRAVCDPTTAATTGLYDVTSGAWWGSLVATIGIPMPALSSPLEPAGVLSPAAADDLGLQPGLAVVHAPGDAVAATIGVLGGATGGTYVSVGTSGWIAQANSQRTTSSAIWLPGLRGDHWIAAAPLLTAGGAIDWVRQVLLGGCSMAEFETLASSTCAASEGVLFLPHLDGVRSPSADSAATGVFVGARRSSTRATIAAAAFEGVAHAIRAAATILSPIDGAVAVCGGLSESAVLCATLADVLGVVVERVAGDDAALRGAWAAAEGGRREVAPAVPVGRLEPRPERHAAHVGIAAIFDELVDRLAPTFNQLGERRADGLQISS